MRWFLQDIIFLRVWKELFDLTVGFKRKAVSQPNVDTGNTVKLPQKAWSQPRPSGFPFKTNKLDNKQSPGGL